MDLKTFFTENPSVALAFSGGTDSSYLLYAGLAYGAKIRAYYVKTAFQPQFEYDDAMRLAEQLGADLRVIHKDVLSNETVAANPQNRCYYCKTEIFTTLRQAAAEDGYSVLIDGTNASDEAGDRPGMLALQELSVRSPLRECGITKADVRALSKEAGLFTWNKPSYACLATRIPAGTPITVEILEQVEHAEDCLFQLGFTDFRIRVFHGAARIQLPADQMEAAISKREELLHALEPYFEQIVLDLKARG
ncbi:MAG: ATP-dependent sacrificial sulfur transferase LarE [Oscillospiraceae bacterium]|jgi:uncharacterized protein